MNISDLPPRHASQGGGALVVSFSLAGPLAEALAQARRASRWRSPRSTASSRSTPAATSRSIPARSISAPGYARRCADRRRRARRADRPHRVIQGDTLLTPDQGNDLGQPLDPDRRHADPPGGGDGARGAARRKRRSSSAPDRDSPSPTASSRGGGKKRELRRADRRQELCASSSIPNKPVKAKEPKDYTIVGKPVPRVDIPDKGHRPLHLHAGLQAAGHAACPRGASRRDRRHARKRRRQRSIKSIPGIVRVVRKGNFLGVVAPTNGPRSRRARDQGHVVGLGGLPEQAKLWEHVRATKVDKDEVTSKRRYRRGASRTAPRNVRRPTTSRSTPTARSARPARSPSSRTAS